MRNDLINKPHEIASYDEYRINNTRPSLDI